MDNLGRGLLVSFRCDARQPTYLIGPSLLLVSFRCDDVRQDTIIFLINLLVSFRCDTTPAATRTTER